MNLPSPVPTVAPGPDWATDNYNCMGLIDAHTHSPGFGVPINPSGININADLTFNNANNAINLRSVRFTSQASPIAASGADLGCIYESGADLYYNDGNGNQVRITSGGSVAGSAGTITGLPSGTASAAYQSGSGTFVFQQATSTAANLDVGSIAIRYPGSYPTPSGNYIQIQAPTALATGFAFTLPAALPGSSGSFLVSDTSGNVSYLTVDNSTLALSGSTVQVKAGGITATQIGAGAIIGTNITGNIDLPGKAVTETGNRLVVSNTNASTNSLAIVRGRVTSGGTKIDGEGFSINLSSSVYTISFSDTFLDAPAVTATVEDTGAIIAVVSSIGTTSFQLRMFNLSGSIVTDQFSFIAIGQRT